MNTNRIRLALKILLGSLVISPHAGALLNVSHNAVPGGVAVVEFASNDADPKAFYSQKPVYIQTKQPGIFQALVGIPLLADIGEKQLTIHDPDERQVSFEVASHTYKHQYITLKGDSKKYVNPLEKHMERIKKERPLLAEARTTFSPTQAISGHFIQPVTGIISSPFGLKRFYNNQPRRPHTGVDFAADIDTPIAAPMDGTVILTGHYFFNGKTVFLDHGQGLISVYTHLNRIDVTTGDKLTQGEVIGGIGQTGRATGPHLHWGVYLNSTAVDPLLFLSNSEH